MQIEEIKPWQWTIVGLFVGLLFGGVWLWKGPWFMAESLDTPDQGEFERQLIGVPARHRDANEIARFNGKNPLVKKLTVHPPVAGDITHAYWVTGKAYSLVQEHKDPKDLKSPMVTVQNWLPFKYEAKTPYIAANGLKGQYPTVVEYLRALKSVPGANFDFQYAWYDQPALVVILPSIAGLLVIGIAWPLTIGLMQGAGMAKPRTVKSKLPKNRVVGSTVVAVDSAAGDKQLDDLNAELEKSLAGFATTSTSTLDDEDEPVPVKVLSGTDRVAGNPSAAKDDASDADANREYGGEFYPVVKKVHKD